MYNQLCRRGAPLSFLCKKIVLYSAWLRLSVKIKRKYFPEEKKYDWLTPLLDAYHIKDKLIELELKREPRRNQLACKKGCHTCCLNPTIHVNRVEFMGLSWFVSEQLTNPLRKKLRSNLEKNHQASLICPFLVDGECSVYLVRPLTCRGFHVLGDPCDVDEDPWLHRKHDIWFPSRKTTKKVALTLMPALGISNKKIQLQEFEKGFMLENARPLHEVDWSKTLEIMSMFDEKE